MKKLLWFLFTLLLLTNLSYAQATYVGSQTCQTCHPTYYNDWSNSGHPYKFSVIHDNQPPTYPPFVVNFEDMWMDSLGSMPHSWDQIAGVIGGFGWKARFVGTDGIIVGTGSSAIDPASGHNQFNFYGGVNRGWVDYHKTDANKKYNYSCFKCHTTGGDTSGTWLSGVDGLGTFTESGIGCEACHGPGSEHAAAPSTTNIDRVYEFAHLDNSIGGLVYAPGDTARPDAASNDVNFLCGTCHNRSYTSPINSSGGFIKHHEQWDEFAASPHKSAGLNCVTCHDPHKRVLWGGDGIKLECASCHTDKPANINHAGTKDCENCHMPYAAKSGATQGESGFQGDVRSHIFKIEVVDTLSIFTEDGSNVRVDPNYGVALNVQFACLGCHNSSSTDTIPNMTATEALAAAKDMHKAVGIHSPGQTVPGDYALGQNYPNPFNPTTRIPYSVKSRSHVELTVYDVTGKKIQTIINEEKSAGNYEATFNAENLAGGIYIIQMRSGSFSSSRKLILVK